MCFFNEHKVRDSMEIFSQNLFRSAWCCFLCMWIFYEVCWMFILMEKNSFLWITFFQGQVSGIFFNYLLAHLRSQFSYFFPILLREVSRFLGSKWAKIGQLVSPLFIVMWNCNVFLELDFVIFWTIFIHCSHFHTIFLTSKKIKLNCSNVDFFNRHFFPFCIKWALDKKPPFHWFNLRSLYIRLEFWLIHYKYLVSIQSVIRANTIKYQESLVSKLSLGSVVGNNCILFQFWKTLPKPDAAYNDYQVLSVIMNLVD
jgi:hypothetical protein